MLLKYSTLSHYNKNKDMLDLEIVIRLQTLSSHSRITPLSLARLLTFEQFSMQSQSCVLFTTNTFSMQSLSCVLFTTNTKSVRTQDKVHVASYQSEGRRYTTKRESATKKLERKKRNGKKNLSTRTSERVPHIRTIRARSGLTSLCGWEAVLSTGYGRDKY